MRIKTALFGFILLAASSAIAQVSTENIDTSVIAKIKNEGLNHSQAYSIISTLCDVYGQRLNWSPEYKNAAVWAASQLNSWGISNVHFENWAPLGKGWSLKKFSLSATSPLNYPIIAYPKAWSPGLDKAIEASTIYLDVKSESDLENYKGKLKNKFVLISPLEEIKPHFEADAKRDVDSVLLKMANASASAQRQRRGGSTDSNSMQKRLQEAQLNAKKIELCQSEGAIALLSSGRADDGTVAVMSASTYKMPASTSDLFGSKVNIYDADAPKVLPQIAISAEQYNRIFRVLQKGVAVKLEMNFKVEFTLADSAFNIIAEIPGSDLKDEIVLIGGHFDSWHTGTGASDNATGTTVALEAIRIIKQLGLQPRRTIRIGLWGGEEQGLLGSRAYVKQHLAEREVSDNSSSAGANSGALIKKSEFEKFSVYFNDDNGAGKFRGINLQGNEAVRPIFRAWLTAINDPSAQTISPQNTGGTDHLSFDGVGVPAFQFIQDPLDYFIRSWHTNMDVLERVPEEDLKQSATMMAIFAYNAAMRDNLIPRKPEPSKGK